MIIAEKLLNSRLKRTSRLLGHKVRWLADAGAADARVCCAYFQDVRGFPRLQIQFAYDLVTLLSAPGHGLTAVGSQARRAMFYHLLPQVRPYLAASHDWQSIV